MVRCRICGKANAARVLGVCGPCIRASWSQVQEAARAAHRLSKAPLPSDPPRAARGVTCTVCTNRCALGEGEVGFCGVRTRRAGKLTTAAETPEAGIVSWYYDPLPTNCVAGPVCPAGSGSGFPRYSYRPGPEHGYTNLAVFPGGCSFDCLFCQNRGHHRMAASGAPLATAQTLASAVLERVACICFFGGDPSPQMPFLLRAATLARQRAEGRILRICWETNGSMHPALLDTAVRLSEESGGCIKFDLKAWNENLHRALTGASNRATLANFARAASRARRRPDPPLVVASTLLVPGYVDEEEVAAIARFIARLDPDTPYVLLAFYPCHLMNDLPPTSRCQAEACLQAARHAGLTRVRLGNVHLLQ